MTEFCKELSDSCERLYSKTIDKCMPEELYAVLLGCTGKRIESGKHLTGSKKLYYISAEFLIGKLLSNNLINMGLYEEVRDFLKKNGQSLAEIEELEPEPSLGNGGLGRLAACFMDSAATLGIPACGVGLCYHFGLFRQVFKDHLQDTVPDRWLQDTSWLRRTEEVYPVTFGAGKDAFTVDARLMEVDVTGYGGNINVLRLFDLDTVNESIVKKGISFDKKAIKKNLTLFLYPDDSDEAGNKLRIYQQYFMVSAGAQMILDDLQKSGHSVTSLPEHAAIQINDTHPSMVIPELIRLLTQKYGVKMHEAIDLVTETCAYTNHTILAEALEKWPLGYLEEIVPQLVPIIRELDSRVKKAFPRKGVNIIDSNKNVHMAHMDIHYGHSVNGVAALHTEILKKSELNKFYKIYPEKFNNKTNGITFRRWLLSCNPELTELLCDTIGDGFKTDASALRLLGRFSDDSGVLDRLDAIKQLKKRQLAEYVYEKEGIKLDTDSIFDVQIKRLHEYKRQQMNVLAIIHRLLQIRQGNYPSRPITYIFGAKAAPAYIIARDIIHLILVLQDIVNSDPVASKWIKIIMVENYNVSYAERIIPACEISEQISLASKEASGTGNMKFMLNGAVTLGTDDGANVEIHDLVGDDAIYIFGKKSQEVMNHYKKMDYVSKDLYKKSHVIKEAVDFITSEEVLKKGHCSNLRRLKKELLVKDYFMTLLDLEEYIGAGDRIYGDYEDRDAWKKMSLKNISMAGFFSSDRTVEEYNRDIWKI